MSVNKIPYIVNIAMYIRTRKITHIVALGLLHCIEDMYPMMVFFHRTQVQLSLIMVHIVHCRGSSVYPLLWVIVYELGIVFHYVVYSLKENKPVAAQIMMCIHYWGEHRWANWITYYAQTDFTFRMCIHLSRRRQSFSLKNPFIGNQEKRLMTYTNNCPTKNTEKFQESK